MKANSGIPVAAVKAHLSLNVADVENSIAFYRAMLGIEPTKVRSDYAKFDVENPPLNLTLNQVAVNSKGTLSHLGIQLASSEDVLSVRERWEAAGLDPHDEMQVNCCYAVQDKTWVLDPDGNEWEAFVVLEDNLSETSMCCATGVENVEQPMESRSTVSPSVPESTLESVACEPGSGCC